MDIKNLNYLYFGSEDSTDIDVMYFIDSMSSTSECKSIIDEIKSGSDLDLDPNLAVVKDGKVVSCFKGTVDEVNNMILSTYKYHSQDNGNTCPITINVKRDVSLKVARVLRGMLSFISRTSYRPIIKAALRGSTRDKVNALKTLQLSQIKDLNKKDLKIEDYYKLVAFQIGQVNPLLTQNAELYTKKSISHYNPELKPYLYKEKSTWDSIDHVKEEFLHLVELHYPDDKIELITEFDEHGKMR